MDDLIGRVTRCSIIGYVGAMRLPEPEVPTFGSYCLAEAQQGQSQVVGLIYDLSVGDDEFARQIAAADAATPEQIADHQQNRQIPVEFSALAIGYRQGEHYQSGLPPQPPLPLSPIMRMPAGELLAFTRNLDFLPLIINAVQIPRDEVVAAALANAAQVRPEGERRAFLLQAGRQAANLLGHDLVRLERVLAAIRPASEQ
jgi:hypothetical protein